MKKCTIITVLINNYDLLHNYNFYNPEFEYICITDNKELTSNKWNIQVIELTDEQKTWSGRKITYYIRYNIDKFCKTDYCLWVDGDIGLDETFYNVLNTQIDNKDFFAMHSYNNYEEYMFSDSSHTINARAYANFVNKKLSERFSYELFKNYIVYASTIRLINLKNKNLIDTMHKTYDFLIDKNNLYDNDVCFFDEPIFSIFAQTYCPDIFGNVTRAHFGFPKYENSEIKINKFKHGTSLIDLNFPYLIVVE